MSRTALVMLLVFLVVGSMLSTANAHYKDAKLEIYKAIVTPVIDGTYNMTLKEMDINGTKVMVDEWNDATWIQIPKNIGKMDAYSAYKHDEEFLYIMHDIPQVTNFHFQGSAGTIFDPKNDGGTQQAKPDDFIVLPYFDKTFQIWMRYGQANGKYGKFQQKPEGLIGNMGMSTSHFSSTPHLFYELRMPLIVGDLYEYLDSTIGICQEIYVHPLDSDSQHEDMYPHIFGEDWIVDNYADATFGKTTNPSVTVPPTVVPEFPIQGAPLVAVMALVGGVMILRKASRVVRRTGP